MMIVIVLLFFSLSSPVYAADTNEAGLNRIELPLADAYDMALKESKELHTARTELQLYEQSLLFQKRKYFPQFNIKYSNRNNVLTAGRDTTSIQVGLGLKQLLFDGGRSALQDESAQIQFGIKTTELQKMENQLIDSVWNNYFQCIFLQEKGSIQKDLLDLSTHHLAITRKQFQQGAISQLSLLDAELEQSRLSLQLAETRLQILQQDYNFREITGLENKVLSLSDSIPLNYTGLDLSIVKSIFHTYARTHNQEIMLLRIKINQSEQQLHYSNYDFLPNISMEGSLSMSGERFPLQHPEYSIQLHFQFPHQLLPLELNVGINENINTNYGSTQSAVLNPFQDFQFIANQQAAVLQHQNLQYLYNEQIKDLEHTIKTQVEKIKQLKLKVQITRNSLEIQERKLALHQHEWEKGLATFGDYTKTEIDHQNSKIMLLQSIFELMQAERQLEKTLGMTPGELKTTIEQTKLATEAVK